MRFLLTVCVLVVCKVACHIWPPAVLDPVHMQAYLSMDRGTWTKLQIWKLREWGIKVEPLRSSLVETSSSGLLTGPQAWRLSFKGQHKNERCNENVSEVCSYPSTQPRECAECPVGARANTGIQTTLPSAMIAKHLAERPPFKSASPWRRTKKVFGLPLIDWYMISKHCALGVFGLGRIKSAI